MSSTTFKPAAVACWRVMGRVATCIVPATSINTLVLGPTGVMLLARSQVFGRRKQTSTAEGAEGAGAGTVGTAAARVGAGAFKVFWLSAFAGTSAVEDSGRSVISWSLELVTWSLSVIGALLAGTVVDSGHLVVSGTGLVASCDWLLGRHSCGLWALRHLLVFGTGLVALGFCDLLPGRHLLVFGTGLVALGFCDLLPGRHSYGLWALRHLFVFGTGLVTWGFCDLLLGRHSCFGLWALRHLLVFGTCLVAFGFCVSGGLDHGVWQGCQALGSGRLAVRLGGGCFRHSLKAHFCKTLL